jgi:hypothetical protein
VLTPAAFDEISTPIIALYQDYTDSVILDIARRLAKMEGVTDTAKWQLYRLQQSGLTYQNALKELSKTTGKSEATLKTLFEQAAVKSLAFDDNIYLGAGLLPLPLHLDHAMAQVLVAGINKTAGLMRNLTLTTAVTAHRAFIDSADKAYMQIVSGSMGYTQAIRAAVKKVASEGLTTIDYASGRHEQIDSSIRRCVLTGVAQTTGTLQLMRAQEMNCTLVATSAHIGARPTHQVWQGKIFALNGFVP